MKCGSPMGNVGEVGDCQNEADSGGHLCPYSQDVDNDYIECECCDECTEACAAAI